jgi:hypothetical protein
MQEVELLDKEVAVVLEDQEIILEVAAVVVLVEQELLAM